MSDTIERQAEFDPNNIDVEVTVNGKPLHDYMFDMEYRIDDATWLEIEARIIFGIAKVVGFDAAERSDFTFTKVLPAVLGRPCGVFCVPDPCECGGCQMAFEELDEDDRPYRRVVYDRVCELMQHNLDYTL